MAKMLFYNVTKFLFIILTCSILVLILYFDRFLNVSMAPYHFYPSSDWLNFWYKENDNGSIEVYRDDTIYILDWTTVFGVPMSMTSSWLTKCPFNCSFINDKSMLKRSHALIFHIEDMRWYNIPSFRSPNQYYVFYYMEPPHKTPIDLTLDETFFNLTLTYRRDSDFVATYGDFRKINKTYSKENYTEIALKKSKKIAWFVSSCDPPNKRQLLIKEMQKYIRVDVYGKCGKLRCPNESYCNEMLKSDYKFYLAFENNLCNDYLTEKLFQRIPYDVVPIVLNRNSYENRLPPKSVISVSDFSTIKELSDYLLLLDKNVTLYLEYFQWRNDYQVLSDLHDCAVPENCGFCALCRFLHKKYKEIRIKRNVYKWWHIDSQCNNSLVLDILSRSAIEDKIF